jgi:glucose/arabinose dehydrogenase
MKKKKFLSISIVSALVGSLALNIGLLNSTQQLNLDSLKWAVKSQFIKYDELKNGKINLLKHDNGGIEYSEFFEESQSKNQKELIKRIGPTFSIFGLAQGAGFNGLPKGLPEEIAKCATKLELDRDLYFTDEALFNREKAFIFYQGDIITNSLLGSRVSVSPCKVEDKYRIQKSVTSWLLSQQTESDLDLNQLPARFAQISDKKFLVVTRTGEICPVPNSYGPKMELECSKAIIDFTNAQKNTHFGVKSILWGKNKLLIAYATNDRNCNRLEIRQFKWKSGEVDKESDQLIYRSPGCFNSKTTELNAVGGRMIFSDPSQEKIIFSLGNAEIWTGLETILSKKEYGNILELDLQLKKSKVLSSGHRNPQGICKAGANLYSSEQGPDGGDELNLIVGKQNYGWPAESYGMPYGEFVSKAVKERSFGSHDSFAKPLISWVPAIAAGDLICPGNKMKGAWSENFILATLKDNSLRRLVLEDGAIRVDEKVPMGARIRDVLIDQKGNLLAFTDSGAMIQMKLIDR